MENPKETFDTSHIEDESALDNKELVHHDIYEPKFIHIKEDLENLFQVKVTSEVSLRYPWVIDELYNAAIKELEQGTPFGLDYMIDEKLLTKEDIQERGITNEMRTNALAILEKYKGPRFTRAKEVFKESGILLEN